jgi:outer membrane receptor protein involved in Fe transport
MVTQAQTAVVHFDLPRQPLADSLRAVGSQTHTNILFDPPLVAGREAPALKADMTPQQALARLLSRTGIEFDYLSETTVVLAAQSALGAGPGTTNGLKVSAGHAVGVAAMNRQASSADAVAPEEVLVTAQKKKEERLQDVPVPMTVINAQSLTSNNQFHLQDYYASVPGMTLAEDSRGAPAISIRGVTTGVGVTSTTGITIDDVPFGASSVSPSFNPAPDVDPNDDLARIEVLRGPQGTLYGAGNLGGLVNYVTIDPSTAGLSGLFQVGTESVHNGDGAGYAASGAVNLPLTDTAAIRMSGFAHQDPGYIDNVLTGQQGVNKSRTDGGRLSTLWRPSAAFTLKVSVLFQDSRSDGSSQVEIAPQFADRQQRFLKGFGGYHRKIQAHSANLSVKIGRAELTSLTGYSKSDVSGSFDETNYLGSEAESWFRIGGVGFPEHNVTEKLSQELRLSVPLAQWVDWLLGAFYTHEKTQADGGQVLEDPVTFERGPEVLSQQLGTKYQEYAAFTDLTFKLSDVFDIQLGGREGRNRQTFDAMATYPYPPGETAALIFPETHSNDKSFTYLFTPRYRLGPDLMTYARIASGYHPGGSNVGSSAVTPAIFAPDKTQNYEVGAKGEFLDRRLSLDASVFHVLWHDIQLLARADNIYSYIVNGSRAQSDGVELSLTAKPLSGLTMSGWAVWNEAKLTEPLPGGCCAGDRLPYSSRFSGYASATQEVPLWADVRGFVTASLSYVGSREAEFNAPRQTLPAYAKTDVQLGMRSEQWQGTVFVTNVIDRRGYLNSQGPFSYVIQPRTMGFNVSLKF